jgi:hypothetical protein
MSIENRSRKDKKQKTRQPQLSLTPKMIRDKNRCVLLAARGEVIIQENDHAAAAESVSLEA